MKYTYKTYGTCSTQIDYELENDVVKNVKFTNGCNGNLKGISALVEGKSKDEIIRLLKGIKCGFKDTSCPDQLARALERGETNA